MTSAQFSFMTTLLVSCENCAVGFAGVFRGQHGHVDDTLSDSFNCQQPSAGY